MVRNKNLIDAHLVRELTGYEKLRALIQAREGSVTRWAVNRSQVPQEVFMTLSGQRPYPEIRQLIADDLGLPREEVDALIEANAKVAA